MQIHCLYYRHPRRTIFFRLLLGGLLLAALVLVERSAGEPADAPLREHVGAHLFVEVNGVLVPVEHAPLHPAHPELGRPAGDGGQHHPAEPAATPGRAHEDVVHVQTGLGEEGGVVGEADHEPCRDAPAAARGGEGGGLGVGQRGRGEVEAAGGDGGGGARDDGGRGEVEDEGGEGGEGRRRRRWEERGGEELLRGGEEVGEELELGHLVDEAADVGHVANIGQAELRPHVAGEGGGDGRRRHLGPAWG
uniref:Uncharacterized protein n=1 Tax=Arundo donax TaxID=35708 RepID=A0A0A9CWV8_ARUDO